MSSVRTRLQYIAIVYINSYLEYSYVCNLIEIIYFYMLSSMSYFR